MWGEQGVLLATVVRGVQPHLEAPQFGIDRPSSLPIEGEVANRSRGAEAESVCRQSARK
jgi:hypothetical protein